MTLPYEPSVCQLIGRTFGWSVCHNFLKGREDSLPCSFRRTCFFLFCVVTRTYICVCMYTSHSLFLFYANFLSYRCLDWPMRGGGTSQSRLLLVQSVSKRHFKAFVIYRNVMFFFVIVAELCRRMRRYSELFLRRSITMSKPFLNRLSNVRRFKQGQGAPLEACLKSTSSLK